MQPRYAVTDPSASNQDRNGFRSAWAPADVGDPAAFNLGALQSVFRTRGMVGGSPSASGQLSAARRCVVTPTTVRPAGGRGSDHDAPPQ